LSAAWSLLIVEALTLSKRYAAPTTPTLNHAQLRRAPNANAATQQRSNDLAALVAVAVLLDQDVRGQRQEPEVTSHTCGSWIGADFLRTR